MTTPKHVKIVGWLSLIWNAIGAAIYMLSRFKVPGFMEQMTPAQEAWFAELPMWAGLFWALGVWGALAGSLLLISKSRFAALAFVISLVGVMANTGYSLSLAGTEIDAPTPIAFSAVLIVISLALWLYSRSLAARGVLR